MIPANAVRIWSDGTNFALSLQDGGKSHVVRIPLSQPDKLVAILQARRRGAIKIAEAGAPTQWNIDAAPRETTHAERTAFTASVLAEIGL